MVLAAGQHPTLSEVVNEVADLRPLGAVATRILEITEDDRFSAHELAQVIATDQALSAKMLRLSNSAYYGFPRTISTVRDAVVLLGFRAVRSATLASCVIDAMEGTTNLDYHDFWHFSVTVGMLAEVLGRATESHQNEAFTGGVMHNIGRLALDQHFPDALNESLAYANEHHVDLHEAQRTVIGFDDARLGGALTLHWNFPQPLVDAVAGHATASNDLTHPQNATGHVVRARLFARSYGLPDGTEQGTRTDPPADWLVPPVSVALTQSGGIDGLLERVDAFLESALS